MDAHKRQLGQTVETYTRKRPRSQIQFTRNLQWSLPAQPRRASRSRAEDLYKTEDSCLEEDNKLEEAITALLQIGRSKPPQGLAGDSPRHSQPVVSRGTACADSTRLRHRGKAEQAATSMEAPLLCLDVQPDACDIATRSSGTPSTQLQRQNSVNTAAKERSDLKISSSATASSTLFPASAPEDAVATRGQGAMQLVKLSTTASASGENDVARSVGSLPMGSSTCSPVGVIPNKQGPCASSGASALGTNRRLQQHRTAVQKRSAHFTREQRVPNSRGGRLLLVPSRAQSTLPEAAMETLLPPPIERNTSGTIIVTSNGTPILDHRRDATLVLSSSSQLALQPRPQAAAQKAAGKPLWQFSSTNASANGGSSSDESSEESWQPNWGLDLFSALNPSVITTGHVSARERGKSGRDPISSKQTAAAE